jgi:hypothetical protein
VSAADVNYCARVIEHYSQSQQRKVSSKLRRRLVSCQAERAAELVVGVRTGRSVLVDDPVGTGKTVVALAAAARLLQSRSVDRVLVVAPNTVVADQWEQRARDILLGGFFDKVPSRHSTPPQPWQKGMVRVVTRRTMGSPPTGTARHLVIVDEAHRGLQHDGKFRKRLEKWGTNNWFMLVTATPFQFSMAGLTTMLQVGGMKSADVSALLEYGQAASNAFKAFHAEGASPDPAEKEHLSELRHQAEAALAHYRRGCSLGEALKVPHPPPLDAPASLDRIQTAPTWRDACEVARLVPELVGLGKGDAFQRRLVSSSEAFWNGAAGTDLERLAATSAPVKKFTTSLRAALGTGTEHPKVAATVAKATTWANQDRRHVLVYCVWTESADAIAKALRAVKGRDFDVERPTGTEVPGPLKRRFQRPPGTGRPVVLVLQDRFSESIDLDGGAPRLIHHDLPWNPARVRQRWGRVVRASSNFEKVPPHGIYVPVLDVHTDERLHHTVLRRYQIGDSVLVPLDAAEGEPGDSDTDDQSVFDTGNFEIFADT